MPCRDDGYDRAAETYASDNRELKKKLQDLQIRQDLTTKLLCDTMKVLTKQGLDQDVVRSVDGLYDWWMKHQEEDRMRHKRTVESAKAKLSREELEALLQDLKK